MFLKHLECPVNRSKLDKKNKQTAIISERKKALW